MRRLSIETDAEIQSLEQDKEPGERLLLNALQA